MCYWWLEKLDAGMNVTTRGTSVTWASVTSVPALLTRIPAGIGSPEVATPPTHSLFRMMPARWISYFDYYS